MEEEQLKSRWSDARLSAAPIDFYRSLRFIVKQKVRVSGGKVLVNVRSGFLTSFIPSCLEKSCLYDTLRLL